MFRVEFFDNDDGDECKDTDDTRPWFRGEEEDEEEDRCDDCDDLLEVDDLCGEDDDDDFPSWAEAAVDADEWDERDERDEIFGKASSFKRQSVAVVSIFFCTAITISSTAKDQNKKIKFVSGGAHTHTSKKGNKFAEKFLQTTHQK